MLALGESPVVLAGHVINWAHPLNRGLVAWWLTLPGRTGLRWLDVVAANHGTLINGPVWRGPSRQGAWGALSFDGINDHVKAPDAATLRISDNFTLALWFRAANTTQSQNYLLSRNNTVDGANQASIIYEYVNNTVEFFALDYTGTDPRTGSGISVADTDWHHIVYAYDGATWSGYKDGVSAFSVSRTFALSTATQDGWFLGSADGVNNPVAAQLDDIRIYTRGLAADEVWQVYTLSRQGYPGVLNRGRSIRVNSAAAAADARPFQRRRDPPRPIPRRARYAA